MWLYGVGSAFKELKKKKSKKLFTNLNGHGHGDDEPQYEHFTKVE